MGTFCQSEDLFCQLWRHVNVSVFSQFRALRPRRACGVCIQRALRRMNSVLICKPARQPAKTPQAATFFMCCFLRCSDDTFSLRAGPLWGRLGVVEDRRRERGGQRRADAFLSEDKGPLRHPLLSSALLSSPSSFHRPPHQSGALHMKRAPPLCRAN